MTTAKKSKRIHTEKALAGYYRNKFAQDTGRKPEEYSGLWVSWDEQKRAYHLRGEGLPAHPDLVGQHPNGWSLSDYIKPAKAAALLGQSVPRESGKRILSVSIKRIADYDADTSDLGAFSDNPGQFAIVHVGEYAGKFADSLPCECDHPDTRHYEDGDNAGKCMDCECEEFARAEVHGDSRLCRYFNPNAQNYAGDCTEEEIEKYCLQDYERMRDLDRGEWGFVGIKASASIQLGTGSVIQTVTSGGIWNVESDQNDSDFRMIEREELDQLRDQLHAIGFSKRAIAAAFRKVEHKDA